MENLRAILLITASMAGFALEDALIKGLSASLPTGQILMLLGLGGALFFGLMARANGHHAVSRLALGRAVMLRNLGEAMGAVGFVTAIVLTPLSSASAILQATPLAVTLGAALFLDEDVGWRRWSAIAAGFLGVLMIIRPGLEGFQPASLFAVLGVAGLALRDLATRVVPREVPTQVLACYGFAILVPGGALQLLLFADPVTLPDARQWALLGLTLGIGLVAYYAITTAMRIGQIAVIMPFRYTRLIFAMIVGALAFGERPDAMTLAGSAVIIGSGLYTLYRETRRGGPRRVRRALPSGQPPV